MARRRRKPEFLSQNCFVYVIATVRDGKESAPVKVGISDNPNARFSQISTASAYPLRLVWAFRMPDRGAALVIEQAFHRALREERLSGEWFQMAPDTALEFIADVIENDWHGSSGGNAPAYLVELLWKFTGFPPLTSLVAEG